MIAMGKVMGITQKNQNFLDGNPRHLSLRLFHPFILQVYILMRILVIYTSLQTTTSPVWRIAYKSKFQKEDCVSVRQNRAMHHVTSPYFCTGFQKK